MKDLTQIIPEIAEIMRPAKEIDARTLVKDVMEIFQQDPSLHALPVTDQDQCLGVINRKVLFIEKLGRPFAIDLYSRKPISQLLPENQFSVAPENDINATLARLLEVDPGLTIDSFPVIHEQRCLGIVSVADLMMKVSSCQSSLFDALKVLSSRINEEVAKAQIIQRDLLPPAEYSDNSITISADLITSSEIGGDFYDYFPLEGDRIGLVVADVSGHGVQAGMVTTAAKASLHTLISQGVTTPAALLSGMNTAILATAKQNLLMTCLIAVIDNSACRVTLANAGHNFPYIFRPDSRDIERLEEFAGYPLGFEKDFAYQECSVDFSLGDVLFLYTDGIIECVNTAGEEFGYERLERVLTMAGKSSPTELLNLLKVSAEKFTGSATFEDDVTMLIAVQTAKPEKLKAEFA
jgi:serine phosphatase RsbU (regulator of sigma subunit)